MSIHMKTDLSYAITADKIRPSKSIKVFNLRSLLYMYMYTIIRLYLLFVFGYGCLR